MKCFLLARSAVDNFVSKLFRKWTIIILLLMSLIVTFVLRFGDSFNCLPNKYANLPLNVMTSMCYRQPLQFMPELKVDSNTRGYPKRYSFYKWVNLMLLLHAVFFYLPYFFWKSYENGFTWRLVSSIESASDENSRSYQLQNIAKCVRNFRGKHMYTILYVVYELANFIISVVAIEYLAKFFEIVPVPETVPFNVTTASDFNAYYFPNMTRCLWEEFDSSGDLWRQATICYLPLNEMYKHIYFFLNGWYICLAVLSSIILVYRIFLLVSPLRFLLMKIRTPLAEISHLHQICYRLSYSDWFFLTRLQKVMMEVDFAELINQVLASPDVKNLEFNMKKDENMENNV